MSRIQMGNDARRRAWAYEGSQGERLLLLALAEHIPNEGHTCWPSHETLAGMVGISTRQIKRILADLEASGAIVMKIGQGRGHTTLYGLLIGLPDDQRAQVTRQIKGDIKGDVVVSPIAQIKGDIKGDVVVSPIIEEKVTFGAVKGDIAMSPRTEKEPKDSQNTHGADPLFQPMFNAVAHACRIDLKLCTNAQRQQVAQTSKALRKAGKLPEEIPKVESWWYAFDWRGKKGEAPRPAQIQEIWQQAMTQEHTNGTHQPNGHANSPRRRTGHIPERLDGG